MPQYCALFNGLKWSFYDACILQHKEEEGEAEVRSQGLLTVVFHRLYSRSLESSMLNKVDTSDRADFGKLLATKITTTKAPR